MTSNSVVFGKHCSRRQSDFDEGAVERYRCLLFLLSFLVIVFHMSWCNCDRTRRLLNLLPSLKATSSSMLPPKISSTKESTSRLSSLLHRSTAVTLRFTSSRFAVRFSPQTVAPHGMDLLLPELSQVSKSCVSSVTRNSRESISSFSINCRIRNAKLPKASC